MTTVTVPATKSPLINLLIRVITSPVAPWDMVASAADLIALDVRLDNWFLTVAKAALPSQEIERVLEVTDEMTTNIERAWLLYEKSTGRNVEELRKHLLDACQRFREILEQSP